MVYYSEKSGFLKFYLKKTTSWHFIENLNYLCRYSIFKDQQFFKRILRIVYSRVIFH